MKIVFTMNEVRRMIRQHVDKCCLQGDCVDPNTPVRFIHQYSDGSGEAGVDDITEVHRIEIDV